VVLVHGFGASNHSWRHWIPALSRRHAVHAVELMGFGAAAAPRGGDYSPQAQAGHLVELLRRLPGPPPVLVGHSLGGCIILLASLRLADEGGAVPLAGLVVMSGPVFPQKLPPFLALARTPGIGELLLAAPPPRWALRAGIRGIVKRKDTVTWEQVDGYRAPLLQRARRRAILRAARQIRPAEANEIATRYHEITLPTLVLWGAADPVVPPAFAPRLEAAMPRARRVMLPGVGHLPAEEAPEASLNAVLGFLDAL
jgi:pimeloyl-ACP methyl ester carboxylesterase